MIIFCFVIAWAIKGALKQGASDARRGIGTARSKARDRSGHVMQKARAHPKRRVRYPAKAAHYGARTGAGVWTGARAAGRGARTAHHSLWTGAKAGAAEGRVKHSAWAERRAGKRQARATANAEARKAWELRFHWPEGVQQGPLDLAHPDGIAVWDKADLERRQAGLDQLVQQGELEGYDMVELGSIDEPAGPDPESSPDAETTTEADVQQTEPDREQIATVTPIREDEPMSTATQAPAGEAIGIIPAIQTAEQWQEWASKGAEGVDAFRASVASTGISGDVLAALANAQDALIAVVKGAFEAAQTDLERHLPAAEAIQALGDDRAESTDVYANG